MCATATSHSPHVRLYGGREISVVKWRLVLENLLFLSNENLFNLQSWLASHKVFAHERGRGKERHVQWISAFTIVLSYFWINASFAWDKLLPARSNCTCRADVVLSFFTVFLMRCSLAVSSVALKVLSLQIAVIALILMPGQGISLCVMRGGSLMAPVPLSCWKNTDSHV